MRNRIALAVFLIGAAPSLWWMWLGLERSLPLVGATFGLTSSSGIGATSGGALEPVFALIALLVVFLLGVFAGRRRTLSRRIARVHRYTSFGIVAIALLLLPFEFVSGWSDLFQRLWNDLFVLSLIGFSLFLPWQALCASAFVALLVAKPSGG